VTQRLQATLAVSVRDEIHRSPTWDAAARGLLLWCDQSSVIAAPGTPFAG
jgi:hypothetical protein